MPNLYNFSDLFNQMHSRCAKIYYFSRTWKKRALLSKIWKNGKSLSHCIKAITKTPTFTVNCSFRLLMIYHIHALFTATVPLGYISIIWHRIFFSVSSAETVKNKMLSKIRSRKNCLPYYFITAKNYSLLLSFLLYRYSLVCLPINMMEVLQEKCWETAICKWPPEILPRKIQWRCIKTWIK